MRATEIRSDYVPTPRIFLMGCQPWPPPADPDRPGVCPVCKGSIRPGDHTTACGWDHRMNPANEARCRSQLIGAKSRDRLDEARQRAKAAIRKKARPRLSEALRRQIANGYKGGIGSEGEGLTNLAREGREFLAEIGQLPNWNLILDSRGNVVGHKSAPEPAA